MRTELLSHPYFLRFLAVTAFIFGFNLNSEQFNEARRPADLARTVQTEIRVRAVGPEEVGNRKLAGHSQTPDATQ